MRGLCENIEEGLIAELRFQLEATSRGMVVCPAPAGTVFDFVAVSGPKCFRVQVKGAHPTRGRGRAREYHVALRRRYSPKTIDVLAVLCKDTGEWKFTTGSRVAGKQDARIRHASTKGSRNHKAPSIRWRSWTIFNH